MYSTFQDAIEHTVGRRRDFFRLVFGNHIGYVCISYKSHLDKSMREKFFLYPDQLDEMCQDVDETAKTLTHVYFCPQLLSGAKRVKRNVKTCTVLWADLDKCNPQQIEVPPSIVVQSSEGRWQALWRLESPLEPEQAEDLSRRIAYHYADLGADRSGWDLTQLLRVPYTPNYKYGDLQSAPLVVVTATNQALYRASDFTSKYKEIKALEFASIPMPDLDILPAEEPIDILQRYRTTLNPQAFGLFSLEPDESEDWSKQQWKLVNFCVEAGLSREETFVVVRDAKCNKYARDFRPLSALWKEVIKAYISHYEQHKMIPNSGAVIPNLISEEEIRKVQRDVTFVERYINWASSLTDAAPQYHQAGAFTILGAVISGAVKLPTSFGTIKPNMWFMLLADTTLTRKSTAMDIAMELLGEVTPDAVMANDGTPEGMLTALKTRAGIPSIYWRDEFTGLLDQIAHKDYMAGMTEHLTKLYDGKRVTRLLRKEEITVNDPVFIILAGGIKTKTQELVDEELVNSGFIPRFVFITAVADPARIRPVGPPVTITDNVKQGIKDELFDIYYFFNKERLVMLPDNREGHMKPNFDCSMTQEAWDRYNALESVLTNAALDTGLPHLTPVYDRLAKSTLKASILIAASRVRDGNSVTVTLDDVLHAIYYCRHWQAYVSEVVNSIGKNSDERLIDRIVDYVTRAGMNGLPRSEIMRMFRLDSKRADLLLTTITQRRLLSVIQLAGQSRYHRNI